MRVVVVTPPLRIVALAAAKAHLRVDDDAEDTLIEAFSDAAQAHIDGPDGWLGRSLGKQTLELRRCGFPTWIELPFAPVVSVASVKYIDQDGAEQTLDPAAYAVHGDIVARAHGVSWPSVRTELESVRIRYDAGYPDTEGAEPKSTVPAPVVSAIKLMIGDLFENRTSVAPGERPKIDMSTTVENLLSLYKVWRV
ncbi:MULTISPECIES: head-tail connector protein [unclassified Bosea (in: a-proteobacteria)]|uniref:head-tail connector protein n=1 Tax=unclassified Bosea (in: a-proteobacteria) TaxID=2653178 RepID=UPI000F756D5B|nr:MULTISPECIES: head-tail connector protein [unclassified Bosea (in: a-proteobacteria)]AZO77490.1 hypothetical protein BLM15_07590 [Bosea sp. Tri-49]RXT18095.1 hypothetical protein B5U98_22740 [Bosea sp. Tri-39]RXT32693.1 hypothetical protein B5U99_29085 [Bosea sp. Tri-54]